MLKLKEYFSLINRNATITLTGSNKDRAYYTGLVRSIPDRYGEWEVSDFKISNEGKISFEIIEPKTEGKFFTTMEKLSLAVSPSYGAVLEYGDKVFVTDCGHPDGFTAEIYEFIDNPEETGLDAYECRLDLIKKAEQRFEDNGHAIEWCLKQKKLTIPHIDKYTP